MLARRGPPPPQGGRHRSECVLLDADSALGSTSFWACKVRCWRWLFGNNNTNL